MPYVMSCHIPTISGMFKPKIIGDTNEQLLTPEDLLSGNAKEKLMDIYPEYSLTNEFDAWLYDSVINAYTHNICSTNDNLTAGEQLGTECCIYTHRTKQTEQPNPADEMYVLNYKKIPEHLLDSEQPNHHWIGSSYKHIWSGYLKLKKEIVDYINENDWIYSSSTGIGETSDALISPRCTAESNYQFNERFIKKLFTQWFNRYVINNHFCKYNQTIEIPFDKIPSLFIHIRLYRCLPDTVENLLYENGWNYEWHGLQKVIIKANKMTDKDNVKLYSPKNMPDFARRAEQEKAKERENAKLLKDFTLWFNQEVKDAYLARYNHKQCIHDTIIVTNDHININLEQVPDKFTELTHDGTALKPSIMQYLLDNDWQYEVTAKKCLQLNL